MYDEIGGQAISPAVLNSGDTDNISAERISGGNIVIAYSDLNNNKAGTFSIFNPLGEQAIGPIVFSHENTSDIAVKGLASGYIFAAYADESNSNAGTFSIYNSVGEIAIGPVIFSENSIAGIRLAQLADGNIFIAYVDAVNSDSGEFVIYGTDGVKSLGPVIFNQGETGNISIAQLTNDNIFIAYTNEAGNGIGEFVEYTTGGELALDSNVFNQAETGSISILKLTDDNVFIAYTNQANSSQGELAVFNTNLDELGEPTVFSFGETGNISITQLANENIFIAYTNNSVVDGEFVIFNSLGEEVIASVIFNNGNTGSLSIAQTVSGYVFIAYSDINTVECTESDWLFYLEPVECPSIGIQTKNWELINNCSGGITHSDSEEVSCDFSLELPLCSGGDWEYSIEPAECPSVGIQTKNWELINNCSGGITHSDGEEISCAFSKVISQEYSNSLKGKIILKVEANGEAYYINNAGAMFFLGRPIDAFSVMREQGIGINNSDLEKIAVGPDEDYSKENTDNNFAASHKGKIFLQVEENGEAWYVYPNDSKRYYLGRPADAFSVMRNLGLGISDNDFSKL